MKKMTLLEKAILAGQTASNQMARPITLEQKQLVAAYLRGEITSADACSAIGKPRNKTSFVVTLVGRAVRAMTRDGELTIKLNGK